MFAAARRRSRGFALAALIGVVLGLSCSLSCGSIPEDELLCEEAVARLEDCCVGFEPARFRCDYAQGCNYSVVPALVERAAQCIRDRSCGDLESSGICRNLTRLSSQPYPAAFRAEIEAEACR